MARGSRLLPRIAAVLIVLGVAVGLFIGHPIKLPSLITGEEVSASEMSAVEVAVLKATEQFQARLGRVDYLRQGVGPGGPMDDCLAALSNRGLIDAEQEHAFAAGCSKVVRTRAECASALDSAFAAERELLARLQTYDDLLMRKTRALGPLAEALREATWPFVEHLKLYPPLAEEFSDLSTPGPSGALEVRGRQDLEKAAGLLDRVASGEIPLEQARPELRELVERISAASSPFARESEYLSRLGALDRDYRTYLDEYRAKMDSAIAEQGKGATGIRQVVAWGLYGIFTALTAAGALLVVWPRRAASPPGPLPTQGGGAGPLSTRTGRQGCRRSQITTLVRKVSGDEATPLVVAAMGFALAIHYLSPDRIGTLLGAGIFALLTLFRPDLALLFVPLAIPIYYRPKLAFGFGPKLVEVILLVIATAWVVRTALGLVVGALRERPLQPHRDTLAPAGSPAGASARLHIRSSLWPKLARALDPGSIGSTLRGNPFLLPLALFVAAAAASLLVPEQSTLKFAQRDFRTSVIEPAIFFMLLVHYTRDREGLERMIGAFIIAAAFVARLGIGQFLFGQGTWSMEGVQRVIGVHPGATAFGIYLGRALPAVLILAVFLPSTRLRYGYALLTPVIGLALLLTWSRGAWVGVALALVAVAVATHHRRLMLGLAVFAAVSLPPLAALGMRRLTSMFEPGTGTVTGRIQLWLAALRIVRDHPLLGAGLDQFLYQDPEKYGVPHVRFMTYSHPHNLILDLWSRIGIFGLAAIIWIVVTFFKQAARLYRWAGSRFVAVASLALAASMVVLVVHGMVDASLFPADLSFSFWLLVGLVEVGRRLELVCQFSQHES